MFETGAREQQGILHSHIVRILNTTLQGEWYGQSILVVYRALGGSKHAWLSLGSKCSTTLAARRCGWMMARSIFLTNDLMID